MVVRPDPYPGSGVRGSEFIGRGLRPCLGSNELLPCSRHPSWSGQGWPAATDWL